MSSIIAVAADSAVRHDAVTAPRIDYLDGWRGLAILLVLQDHFYPIAGYQGGFLGVDVFFCLSGMLISRILFEQRMELAKFYKRRISRILPAFVLFVTLMYGIALADGHPGSWTEFIATLAFLRTYVPAEPDIWNTGLPLGHLWSLNVEEHGYVLLSGITLLALARLRAGGILILFGVAAVGIYAAYRHFAAWAPQNFEIRTETSGAYLLLSAGYFLLHERVVPFVRPWMPPTALALAAVCYLGALPGWVMLAPPFLLAFAVNHLGQTTAGLRATLASAPLRLFGICSYSLYLWQQPFYELKTQLSSGLALLCALLAGAASFYLFENPVRTWLNRHW